MSIMKIESNIRNYQVQFKDAKEYLAGIGKVSINCSYIIDSNVWKLYQKSCLSELNKADIAVLPISEEKKCLTTVQELYDRLIDRSAKRNMTMISIGGGIIQDITGFAASTLYRGINWIFIPTTLLAQADSCIGSKTSLNYQGFKNLIGTFYPPSEICIDSKFLRTQNDVDFYSGLGEVIKLYIMGGESDLENIVRLLPNLINRQEKSLKTAISNSLIIKRQYMTGDEFDAGKRNLLNYGHCFGHAIESVSNFEIPHGQAVVIGMILANLIAKKRNLLEPKVESYVLNEVLLPSIKVMIKKQFLNVEAIIVSMKKDKKRIGDELPLVMLSNNFKMIKVNDVKDSEVEASIKELIGILNTRNFKKENR